MKARVFDHPIGFYGLQIVKIPCIFPDDQGEFDRGDWFASDCIIRRSDFNFPVAK
jgi:hypothetical protein